MRHLQDCVGNTPLVALQRLWKGEYCAVLAKLEGDNPAGSVKDRPALNMINRAQMRGDIKPGDVIIEATSGNTGIALAMAAAMMGYKMVLIMPDNMSSERVASMRAYGAQIILVSAQDGGMELARDTAQRMQSEGKGIVLDQFSNPDNWMAHYESTGPEIWCDTQSQVTHFVSSMGTTGTIMGVSRYLKEQNNEIKIIGVQPEDEAQIPGIRRWPQAYLPKIYEPSRVDEIIDVGQKKAEDTMREMAKKEGIFAGVSSGGAMAVALDVAHKLESQKKKSTVVSIVCDRGDRYLSTGVY